MRKVPVALGGRSYDILVGRGLLARLGRECRRLGLGSRCAVITDTGVAPHYLDPCLASLVEAGFQPAALSVPAGESSKSLRWVGSCYDRLAAHRLERRSFIIALGGGVVGDLAGFVAATYLRGLPFVQVPTTLLAQVDSSVGGKTGFNLRAGKNLVGAFWQPRLVVCDLDTLRTLPPREYRSGLAEVIKYGVIQDAGLFARLERTLPRLLEQDARELTHVVARCCAIKADVVGQDETESGLRATLNFGHTIGHALEAIAGYGRYRHGEAISIGQVLAARLSARCLGLPASDVARITGLLQASGLPITTPIKGTRRTRLLQAIRLDKKVQGGEIKFVLASAIGRVQFGVSVPAAELEAVLDRAGRAP